MESNGVEGRIHVSQSVYEELRNDYIFDERGFEVVGTGRLLSYLYKDRKFAKTESGHFVRKATLTPPNLRKRELTM